MDSTFTEKRLMRAYDRRADAIYNDFLKAVNDDPRDANVFRALDRSLARLADLSADHQKACYEAWERSRADDDRNTMPGDENGSEG